MKLILLFCLLLFHLVYSDSYDQHVLFESNVPIVKSVAIIGGGASGTSTAFWLNNVFNNTNDISITLFDNHDYIGGRSTVVPIKGNASLRVLELGASIFVQVNTNLMKAADKFGLKRVDLDQLDDLSLFAKDRPTFGVWDGKEFVFESKAGYWDKLKTLWKFGLPMYKFDGQQRNVVKRFMDIYNVDHGFEHVSDIVKQLDLQKLVNITAQQYFKELGTDDQFAQKVLQTATRGNYCQDLDAIHAFAVMVSMEADHHTYAIEDGNYRIFEEFARHSKATVKLQTKVVSVTNMIELDSRGNDVTRYVVETSDGSRDVFDDVVLATPIKYSGIKFSFPTEEEHREYHTVYVTLVAGFPNPAYFGRDIKDMPAFVVTAGGSLVTEGQTPPFYTFSVHRFMQDGESVIKIFSSTELTDNLLDQLFLNKSWVYQQPWHAFPKLTPVPNTQDFPSLVLKQHQDDDSGILYTGAFESFISTMETQTVAGKNAARLLHEKWCSTKSGFNRNCPEFGDGWGKEN